MNPFLHNPVAFAPAFAPADAAAVGTSPRAPEVGPVPRTPEVAASTEHTMTPPASATDAPPTRPAAHLPRPSARPAARVAAGAGGSDAGGRAGRRWGRRLGILALAAGMSLTAASAAAMDVNTATAEQLQSLRGVGPKTAAIIIHERQRGGNFQSLEDLSDRVRGIGAKKARALQEAGLSIGAGTGAAAAGKPGAPAGAQPGPAGTEPGKPAARSGRQGARRGSGRP